jgi:hypothetical protein
MKKKTVLRLLSSVMAATLVVTGVPSAALTGIETVYAEEGNKPKTGTLLTNGSAVYAKVKKGIHDHTTACYTSTAGTVVEVQAGDKYFKEIDESAYTALKDDTSLTEGEDYVKVEQKSTEGDGQQNTTTYKYYQKVDEGKFVVRPTDSADETWTLEDGSYIVVVKEPVKSDDDADEKEGGEEEPKTEDVAHVYDAVTDKTTENAINEANANQTDEGGETAIGAKVVYLKSTDLDTINGAYASGTDTTEATNSKTNLHASGASITDGLFVVEKYAKADTSVASTDGIPGAIVIPEEPDTTNTYKTDYGFESPQEGDIYVPLIVSASEYEGPKEDDTVTLGEGGNAKTYLAITDEDSVIWVDTTEDSVNTPAKAWVYDKTAAEGSGAFVLQVVSSVLTDSDLSEEVDHTSYTYQKPHIHKTDCDVVGCDADDPEYDGEEDDPDNTEDFEHGVVAFVETEITGEDIKNIVEVAGTNGAEATYYYNIIDQFAQSITLTDTETTLQYVTSETIEGTLEDGVTITMGGEGTQAVTADKDAVISNYDKNTTYAGAGKDNVQIKKIYADAMYYLDKSADKDYIIDSEDEIGLVSTISDYTAANLTALGLKNSKTDYAVETVSAASIDLSIETQQTVTDEAGDKIYLTTESPAVTATIGEEPTISNAKWQYTWSDTVGLDDDNKNTTVQAAEKGSVAAYTMDKTPGKHTITLIAELVNSDNTSTVYATIKSNPITVYIVQEDDTSITFEGNKEYTGSPIGLDEITPKAGQDVKVEYEGTGSTTYEKSTTAPTNVGTYKYTVTIAADLEAGYKETVTTGNFAITAKKLTVNDSDTVLAYDKSGTNSHEADLSKLLKATAAGEAAVSSSVEITTKFASESDSSIFESGSINYDVETGKLSYALDETNASAGHAAETITGTISTGNYEITINYSVAIAAEGTTIQNPTLIEKTYYYGDKASTYDGAKTDLVESPESTGSYTFSYQALGTSADASENFPTEVGTYVVTVKYSDTNVIGQSTTLITIAKKPVKVTITSKKPSTVESGTTDPAELPGNDIVVEAKNGDALTKIDGLEDAVIYKLDGKVVPTTSEDAATVGDVPGIYEVTLDTTNFEDKYDIEIVPGSLIVQKTLHLTAEDVTSGAGATPQYDYSLEDAIGFATTLPANTSVKYALTKEDGTPVNGNPTKVGDYTITPSIDFSECEDPEATAALYNVVVKTGILTVDKGWLGIAANNASYTIGQTGEPDYSYTATSFGSEVTLNNPTVVYTLYKYETDEEVDLADVKAGTRYTIKVKVTLTDEDDIAAYDYDDDCYEDGTLEVNPRQVTITVTKASVNAGSKFTPTITVKDATTGEILTGVKTTYKVYNKSNKEVKLATALQTVGTYTIKADSANDNYNAAKVGTATLTVKDGSKVKDKVTYDGNTYTVTNIKSDTVEFTSFKKNATSVTVPATIKIYGVTYKVTSINAKAFNKKTTLKTVTIKAGVTSIAASAFAGCTKLTTVTLPTTVTTIGKSAFSGCKALKSITIPAKVKTIGASAFANCAALKTVTFKGTALTSIAASTFSGCKALTKIVITKNVKTIGASAFANCAALTSVTFKGTAVTSIGDKAFYGCKKLASFTIPAKVKTIGASAFYGCAKLKTVTIKGTALTKVGKNAFTKIASKATVKVPAKKLAAYKKLLKSYKVTVKK